MEHEDMTDDSMDWGDDSKLTGQVTLKWHSAWQAAEHREDKEQHSQNISPVNEISGDLCRNFDFVQNGQKLEVRTGDNYSENGARHQNEQSQCIVQMASLDQCLCNTTNHTEAECMLLGECSQASCSAKRNHSSKEFTTDKLESSQEYLETKSRHDPSTDLQKSGFTIDKTKISAIPMSQQADELQDLDLVVFNQNEFEQGVMAQVDQALAVCEKQRMIQMTEKEMNCLSEDLRIVSQELQSTEKVISMLKAEAGNNKVIQKQLQSVIQQRELKLKQVKRVKAKMESLHSRINSDLDSWITTDNDEYDTDLGQRSQTILEQTLSGAGETEHERMIRLGEMTPFGTVMSPPKSASSDQQGQRVKPTSKCDVSLFDNYLCEQQQKSMARIKVKSKLKHKTEKISNLSSSEKRDLVKSGQLKPENGKLKHSSHVRSQSNDKLLLHRDNKTEFKHKSNKNPAVSRKDVATSCDKKSSDVRDQRLKIPKLEHNFSEDGSLEDFCVGDENLDDDLLSDEEYIPEEEEELEEENEGLKHGLAKAKAKKRKASLTLSHDECHIDVSAAKKKTPKKCRHHPSKDDGSIVAYTKRLKCLAKEKLLKKQERLAAGKETSDSDSDVEIGEGFKVPTSLWNKLYRYQKTGVRWLYELHCQQAGGIVGDEMGLGKTIQMIAFLAGLKYSKLRDKGPHSKYCGLGPTIIITPATVMHQWVKEFHTWWPPFRVAVLHASGSYTSSDISLMESIIKCNGILITGYNALVLRQDAILKYDWHYVILDEGHKIRNPDAKVTVAAKMFRTCHRIILSGSPMQNNLKELWSLFDFVFPGKLGTLPDFMAHFSVPIVQGGYANATDVQVRTAYKCACVLRDTINPYLLRRMKADVQNSLQLPDKNEQVLFCRLTDHQKEVYVEYLQSRECKQILDGKYMVFAGLVTLRKICNHPDLCTGGPKVFDPEEHREDDKSLSYGYWKRSGKMIVVESLLKLWKKQGQRVLLFSQSKQMLDILESFVRDRQYSYLRMDGGTAIGSRQSLIEQYNQDNSIYVFLLTTRVGGLGVNLTGANRVIIFDPDWNPSTDTQARERAWRIGQKKQVTIYRLLTTGTIEEKIYHRQIFKQFLTNRVLKDPKQRRFFKSNDLYDLFTLNDDNPRSNTETSDIFAGTGSEVKVKLGSKIKSKHPESKAHIKNNRFDILHEKTGGTHIESEDLSLVSEPEKSNADNDEESSTDTQLNKLREVARKLSMKIAGLSPDDGAVTNDINVQCDVSNGKRHDSKHRMHDSGKHKGKRKDKKRKKDLYLDGEKIAYLVSCDVYKKNAEDDAKANDDYVLEKLFRKKGLHSALHHDKIMMSSDPDFTLVESEAERVAKEAALALKRSRAQCFKANTGVPTWTGLSGVQAARPRFGQKKKPGVVTDGTPNTVKSPPMKPSPKLETSHFDGRIAGSNTTTNSEASVMSSEDLLARMKKRNQMIKPASLRQAEDEEDGAATVMSLDLSAEDTELITDIRNTIAFSCRVDGQASTQELLDKFCSRVKPEDSAKFKAMLRSICDFEKFGDIGVWKLKPEFR